MKRVASIGYSKLPPSMQSSVAGIRGMLLNWRRYSSVTPRLVVEAKERECWNDKAWSDYQYSHLAEILEIARNHVPFYRDVWRSRGEANSSRLSEWPLLDKESLRQSPESFVSTRAKRWRLSKVHTSGTTGKPLSLWRSRKTNIEWHALYEARWRGWYGLSRFDNWALLGGQLVVPVDRIRPPFWVWNRAMRQLYCSVYHLSAETVSAYVAAFKRYEVDYILGYPSAICELARGICEQSVSVPRIRVVLTIAEPLSLDQRQLIESAFECPVRETYGMTEIAAGAGECEHGRMHSWPDASVLEILDDEGDLALQGSGELIATSLINREMPLIRYRTGDRVRLDSATRDCPCGRRLPVITSIEGRCDDLLKTPDGRTIGRLDPVLKGGLDIQEAQIIQESANAVVLRYVSSSHNVRGLELKLKKALNERLGSMAVRIERVQAIPRGKNGKFRAVINNVVVKE